MPMFQNKQDVALTSEYKILSPEDLSADELEILFQNYGYQARYGVTEEGVTSLEALIKHHVKQLESPDACPVGEIGWPCQWNARKRYC